MGTKIRFALMVEEVQLGRLQRLSDESGASLAELIRRAIDQFVSQREGRSVPDSPTNKHTGGTRG